MKTKIEVARVFKTDGGTTKAYIDLCVLDCIIIKGIRIVQGEKGLFVSMPQETGKDGKYYQTVIPITREVRDEIETVALKAYARER